MTKLLKFISVILAGAVLAITSFGSAMAAGPGVDGGIEVTVTRGPISPVCILNCYAPYSTEFVVSRRDGHTVKRFWSNEQGYFRLTIQPGTYIVTPAQPSGVRLWTNVVSPQTVKVTAHQYSHITFNFDTGIR